MRDYTKIEAWKLADDLIVAVYRATKSFPKEELYGLTSQFRRAAVSVPANIVEGSARGTKRDYLHFLYIARGSLAETRYFIHLSHRLGYLPGSDHGKLEAQANSAAACLQGLINSVEKETGKPAKLAAALTSALVLALARWTFSHVTT
ncbi:MAG: four helix bundle protein [Armatimonadetes bacterium CG_4_9_14_3_um_filter_66_14]|nr:MAG: four helix bundle protein [Armatimonadetes bacterium CG_4_9_14_3_um_filter_66_14]